MRYGVLYPQAENVHLIKDVGIIAYKLHKNYGYDAFVICYKNGEYDYLNNEVKGLGQELINKKHGHIRNIYSYLKKNSKSIDTLQIFHMTSKSVIYAALYKFFNKKGIIFLKLDCTEELVQKVKNMKLYEKILFGFFLNRVDIIGVEQEKIYSELKVLLKNYEKKLLYVPNGIDFKRECLRENTNFKDKENVVLTVGRIGSPEKASELLMNAFSKLDDKTIEGWKLVFVGPIEKDFEKVIDKYFEKNKRLKDKVIFKGPIFNRDQLYMEYKKAKIFALTSDFESFGIALIEAAAFGDVIVATKVGIAEELVQGDNGEVIAVRDEAALTKALERLMKDETLNKKSEAIKEFCRRNYNLDFIVENLNNKIEKLRGNV